MPRGAEQLVQTIAWLTCFCLFFPSWLGSYDTLNFDISDTNVGESSPVSDLLREKIDFRFGVSTGGGAPIWLVEDSGFTESNST